MQKQEKKYIDGKACSLAIREKLKHKIQTIFLNKGLRAPGLATILVGEDPASHIYVSHKQKAAKKIGIEAFHYQMDENISEAELITLIKKLNNTAEIDGILVQLPLPQHLSTKIILNHIDPKKDVDGFHPENVAKLSMGLPGMVPCTPKGCMRLLKESGVAIKGAHAVVIGRSPLVGRPMARILLAHHATVTTCHRYTKDLKQHTQMADILVVAVGKAHFIGADHIKAGAVVIDVGINRLESGKLVGDVDTQAVLPFVSKITPVPGGVGPMTIAMLMENTIAAYENIL